MKENIHSFFLTKFILTFIVKKSFRLVLQTITPLVMRTNFFFFLVFNKVD